MLIMKSSRTKKKRIRLLEQKYENEISALKQDMETKFNQILNKINLVELH